MSTERRFPFCSGTECCTSTVRSENERGQSLRIDEVKRDREYEGEKERKRTHASASRCFLSMVASDSIDCTRR